MKRKVISAVLAATMAVTMMMGCGSTGTSADGNGSTSKSEESGNDGGKVTLKVFSNLPDRKTGQGLVEQTIIDEYMKENPNVEIKVEALDEESYKTKFYGWHAGCGKHLGTAGILRRGSGCRSSCRIKRERLRGLQLYSRLFGRI